ncbi:zinc-binding dehydrogenase [Microbulbifer thermotolerans]|uniref:Zinc-binding dehydrogenase n=1 Tax=Microbulbifer thermotolerans TaxID=252514 RepID=A0AB35I038_MICTH|nr:zinc-binding dehydrogenase [Microbulbifer thermotolerans]MCX2782844.1 zinc-binding dehydrogenase [Microbulbifer thermotolerans]MCX2794086.1 zinc-binding dehydrogenase [Microbulbifer thermotolerans]MCX2802981.1 zinc-binding dehydrogenase [Microbulbifer thermotolerans]MCX2830716.1 zinc-binding dehydrogenase [Microbulbifer thermotolerans]MCX2840984.1 zinc-binding dehydrogenase [Microbulbifer thermotolerans]
MGARAAVDRRENPPPAGERRTVWQTPGAGDIARLCLRTEPLATLPVTSVRVTVRAVGLNFADIFALTGLYSATPRGAFIPGLEFAGEVSAVGGEASGFSPGDRVMGVTRFGGYASVIDCEPDYLMPLPDDWDFAQGAAWPVQSLTAWYALTRLGALRSGERVLIHSAAGGVGLQAMQLTRALGGSPVGTVGSEDKAVRLRELGFDDVLVREKNFHRQLQRTGLSFDLVLDAIGGAVQKASFAALKPMGRLVVFGAAEFTPRGKRPDYLRAAWRYLRRPRYDVMDMISSNRSVLAFNLIWLWDRKAEMQSLLAELGDVPLPPPLVGRRFSFADAHAALDFLRSGRSVGKVVLEC